MILTGTTIFAVLGAALLTAGGAALGNFIGHEVVDISKEIEKNKSLENGTENQKTNNFRETEEGKKEDEINKSLLAADEKAADERMQKDLEIAAMLEAAGEKFNWENETNDINTEENIVPITPNETLPPQNNRPSIGTIIDPIPPISGMDSVLPGIPTQEQGPIKDTTDENLGTNNMTPIDWMKWAEEQQQKRWEREDQIRKETQAREDTAWQRGIEDLLKSGANPNLVGASPAQSGGGITQATGQDLTGLVNSMNIDAEKLMQIIDNNFKGNENEKERLLETITNILSTLGMIIAFKKR